MKNLLYTLSLLLLGIMVVSCGDDEEPVLAPTANFTSAVDGKTVTLTNTSVGATSFAWEFGDGETSTDESPSHTYEKNGSYVTKLTVTNVTGTDSKQEVFEIINIAIDGSFDDWADVDAAITNTVGSITTVKIENLENNKLFIYIEGTDALTGALGLYLNTDNDTLTGANIDWQYADGGDEFVIEGVIGAPLADRFAELWSCNICEGAPLGTWNFVGAGSQVNVLDLIETSELQSIPGGNAYEFSLDLTGLGYPIDSDAIGIGMTNIDVVTWGPPQGVIPAFINEDTNPNGEMHIYTF